MGLFYILNAFWGNLVWYFTSKMLVPHYYLHVGLYLDGTIKIIKKTTQHVTEPLQLILWFSDWVSRAFLGSTFFGVFALNNCGSNVLFGVDDCVFALAR